jgi:hypothetical protein
MADTTQFVPGSLYNRPYSKGNQELYYAPVGEDFDPSSKRFTSEYEVTHSDTKFVFHYLTIQHMPSVPT